jgi:hypothetical protein
MRQSFIQVVKQMDPMDALVLKAIPRDFQAAINREAIASKLNCSTDDVQVSFDHLLALDCIVLGDRPYLKAFGTLLMNVLSG